MKNKFFLISITILLVIAISIGIFYFDYSKKDNNGKENINNIEQEQKETEEVKEIKNENFEESITEINDKISDVTNVEIIEEEISDENTIIQNDETSIINSTSNSEPTLEYTPTCTPKKFDISFARADFESMDACQSKGNQYMEYDYGYICDYFPDNCGTYYYMLTLFDTNGTHYDYHDVEIPE